MGREWVQLEAGEVATHSTAPSLHRDSASGALMLTCVQIASPATATAG